MNPPPHVKQVALRQTSPRTICTPYNTIHHLLNLAHDTISAALTNRHAQPSLSVVPFWKLTLLNLPMEKGILAANFLPFWWMFRLGPVLFILSCEDLSFEVKISNFTRIQKLYPIRKKRKSYMQKVFDKITRYKLCLVIHLEIIMSYFIVQSWTTLVEDHISVLWWVLKQYCKYSF